MLPYSEQTEAALIARLIVDPTPIPMLHLAPEDFFVKLYRQAWRAMLSLTAQHKPIDLITLADEGVDLSDALSQTSPGHRAPVEEYAQIVKRDAFRRRVISAADGISRTAAESEDQQQILSELQTANAAILREIETGNLLSMDKAIEQYELELLERTRRGGGLAYGLGELDALIQPSQGGDMIVIAARPSVGKTAFLETITDTWAYGAPFPVLFVSIEMSMTQLLDRAVSRYGGLDASRVQRGQLTDEELNLAADALDSRHGINVYYLDDPYATTSSVRAAAAKLRMSTGGLTGIAIDYLGLLKDPGDQETQRVTRISRDIKAIARENDVPLIVACQLNRALEGREDKHPRLHDLRDSGAIEQDADVVVGLYRPLGTTQMEIGVLKNRRGPVEDYFPVRFDPSHVRYDA